METFLDPDAAIDAIADQLAVVKSEVSGPQVGRVLAEPILADRDSPAANVSAMDGYAVRLSDLINPVVAVSGESQPGAAPEKLAPGTAMRIFTGAVVPEGAQAVVVREHTDESTRGQVRWLAEAAQTQAEANIRFQGENGKRGETVIDAGTVLEPGAIAAAVSFGASSVTLRRRVRVTVIVTGNELLDIASLPAPWQIRDSNGPTIEAVCASRPWIDCVNVTRCDDDAERLTRRLRDALAVSDAIILTGGVSKGDYDHVPEVTASLGARVIFHRLPIRPGRPILGAVTDQGQLILGLPGNPVSSIVGMNEFGLPLLAKQSGQLHWKARRTSLVTVHGQTDKTLPIHWYRLVQATEVGHAMILDTQGSGDLVALARSTGYIHQPPGQSGPGPWPMVTW